MLGLSGGQHSTWVERLAAQALSKARCRVYVCEKCACVERGHGKEEQLDRKSGGRVRKRQCIKVCEVCACKRQKYTHERERIPVITRHH